MADNWSLGICAYMLISGQKPLSNYVLKKIIKRSALKKMYTIDYNTPYWDIQPLVAKDFVQRLLTIEPEKRMTIKEAMEHEWLITP